MGNIMKGVMRDEIEGFELDPQLWQTFLEELLGKVITKLPFSTTVAFRTICKRWYPEIIPRAAPEVEASSGCSLLYLTFLYQNNGGELKCSDEGDSKGFLWWLRLSKSIGKQTSPAEVFRQKSFPLLSNSEEIQLMICEGGLLFFSLIYKKRKMVKYIIICNPLNFSVQNFVFAIPV